MPAHDPPIPDWPFADPPDRLTFTTRAVLEEHLPILLVSHDEDGDWQFLCGTTNEPAEGRVIHLLHVLEMDDGLAALADLPLGWIAWRATSSGAWIREPQ